MMRIKFEPLTSNKLIQALQMYPNLYHVCVAISEIYVLNLLEI